MRLGNYETLLERNRGLEARLEEAEETLRAIRNGEVDAVVTAGPDGDRVYTLRGADEAYRVIVQEMAEGALTLTLDGLILFSNDQFASIAGIPLERVIGSHIHNFVAPEDAHVVSALLAGDNGRKAEVRLKANGVGTVPVYLSANTLVLDGVRCVCLIVTDLTEQKRNEEIVAAGKLARSILDQAAGAILVVDPGGRIIRASRGAEKLAKSAVLLQPFDSVFFLRASSDGKQFPFEEILSTIQRNGEIAAIEATARMPDGHILDVLVNAELLTDSDSELLGCTIVLSDVTGLKLAEKALLESEGRYRSLFENSLDAVFLTMGDGRTLAANPAACALFGMTEEEICQRGRDGLIDAADPNVMAAINERGSTWHVRGELTFIRKDGSRFLGEVSSVVVDELRRTFVIVRDVTERRKAENDLRESEERYRLLIEASPMGVISGSVAGEDFGKVDSVNEALLRMFGRTRHEFESAPPRWPDVTPPECLPRHLAAIVEARASGVSKPYEVELIRRDGSRIPVMVALAVLGEKGERSVGFIADLTEQKRSEERLRQTQKLESIGLLAGGIAHDFNNLLTGIMGNASLVMEEVNPKIAKSIEAIISSAARAADLTRQLLAYSGKGQFVLKDLDLSCAVHEMADLLHLSIPKTVDLRLDVQERLPSVLMDPGQLQQILMNLVINAGEAIGESKPGRILVSTEICDLDCEMVDALGAEVAPGRYVALEVTDTGPGMGEELKSRIFDPFFTTKFTGRGLGLAAVSGIVRSQKGAITVRTAPGQGSTFRVLLRAAQSGKREIKEEPADFSRGTILVVDDEEGVRNFISTVLRKKGYRVLEACDGKEALALCVKEDRGLSVVVLDIVMPVMSGGEFLDRVKSVRPDLKVLLTSGYSEAEARHVCAGYEGAAFIQKPYTAHQLEGAVESLFLPSS
jgi:PAS domain S-box-containing protein